MTPSSIIKLIVAILLASLLPLADLVELVWLKIALRATMCLPLCWLIGSSFARAKIADVNTQHWKKGYFDLLRQWNQFIVNFLAHNLENAFEDSLNITTHFAAVKDNKVICKIGDDDVLVDVDMEMVRKADFPEALKKAYEEFMAKKCTLE